MTRFTLFCLALLPVSAWAEGYERPIPQAQSATAEFWYAFACIAFITALIGVARLVSKR